MKIEIHWKCHCVKAAPVPWPLQLAHVQSGAGLLYFGCACGMWGAAAGDREACERPIPQRASVRPAQNPGRRMRRGRLPCQMVPHPNTTPPRLEASKEPRHNPGSDAYVRHGHAMAHGACEKRVLAVLRPREYGVKDGECPRCSPKHGFADGPCS